MNKYLSYGNKGWLLNNIDQKKVWDSIVSFEVGKPILNPLRNDKNLGSCSIQLDKQGRLNLVDYADKRTNGFDCISAYRYLHPHKSWDEVCYDLLNIGKALPTSAYKVIPGIKKKEEVKFTPLYRDWLQSDLDWWFKRGIFKSQLERDITLTKPVKGYIQTKENKQSEVHFNEMCYCYHHQDKVKFYFPERKQWRFLGNMGKDDVWFLNRNSDVLFICKSHKDLMVIENLCDFNLTMIQSETNYPEKDKFFEWECNHKQIFVCTDNDETGRKIAQEIQKQFLYIPCEIIEIEPETKIKDFDEYFVQNGLNETIDYFNYLLLK